MEPGQRVECLLNRGEADVFYPGTAIDAEHVRLDDYPYGEPVVGPGDIADWRPL